MYCLAVRLLVGRPARVDHEKQMSNKHSGRLELTWTDKDKVLLSIADGKYDYTFVQRSDYRVSEVRLLDLVERVEGAAPSTGIAEDLPSPTTENLLITGDAMHVLDVLAKVPEYADKYLGKVKLVYIDPPFNTGKAFQHYEDNIAHSIWLTMLRDRLRQIKPLLSKEGTAWVHLDASEVHRCRVVMDEELGADNFLAEIAWQRADGTRNDVNGFSASHDTILVYRRSDACKLNTLPRSAEMDMRFESPDGDQEVWFDGDPTAPGARSNDETSIYGIQHPVTGELQYPSRGRHWAAGQTWMLAQMQQWAPCELRVIDDADRRAAIRGIPQEAARPGVPAIMLSRPLPESARLARMRYEQGNWPGIILRSGGTGGLGRKSRIPETGRIPDTWWQNIEVGHNRQAKSEIKALFPDQEPFATPKPERLLHRIVQIGSNPGDIVLDCYGGSGTTAAVAHKMGRRWVTSELLPETVERYTKPRLLKVLYGADSGGVTTTVERVAEGDLPEDMSPREAQEFTRLLGKVTKSEDPILVDLAAELARLVRAAKRNGNSTIDAAQTKQLLGLLKLFAPEGAPVDLLPAAKTYLARRTRTKDKVIQNWLGGGGFLHMRIRPSMFEEIGGIVLLADWAAQGELAAAMCAQVGVRYKPDGIFAGTRGKVRFVVIDGLVGTSTVQSILDQLPSGAAVEVWATQFDEDAASLLKQQCPGSRLEAIPESVLRRYRRRAAKGSPFAKLEMANA